jgi:hypothetical protein
MTQSTSAIWQRRLSAPAWAAQGAIDVVLAHDQRRQVYAVYGEGPIEVIQQRDADHYALIESVPTSPGARSGLFVSRSSTLFVAVPARADATAEIRAYEIK